jgi:uncharacterized protein (DUF2126 family)/transglutaminase-like putative cysteine protease
MGIRVALHHRTQYRYDEPVTLGPQFVRLRPAPHCRTPILGYSLKIDPANHSIHWQQDPHNNHVARLVFPGKTKDFVVEVDLIAELSAFNPFDFFLEPGVEEYPFEYAPELANVLESYRSTEPAGPRLRSFLETVSREKCATMSFLVDLNRRVRDEVGYRVRLERGVQTPEQTLERGTGSCRDSAWLLVEALRHSGIAARFVSGYLIQLAPDEHPAGEPSLPAADSSDLHAWAEVFLSGAGWIGLDPTSGLLAGEGHIPLASTPDACMAAPIAGTAEAANVSFDYAISVRRLNEAARPAKPFTEEAWARVEQVAHKIDADLVAQDVRLTMGGEPTFVGIDEPESPQWNIDALGELKRSRGLTMLRDLRDRMAPGALLHFGQGKWYPGEPLPRWALGCYWRPDGVPIWENPNLIAHEDRNYGFDLADALRFMEALTRRLQVSSSNILPAYQDEIPSTEPSGYVLPIRRRQLRDRLFWSSQLWFPRPERFVLMPGDSPIGYRLPLASMPWVTPDEIEYEYEHDSLGEREKLPSHPARRLDLFAAGPEEDPLPAISTASESAGEKIRPALSVEVREGRLHVFLPYAAKLADYLDLLAAVEDTCSYLQKPVWVEGYVPPSEPRLRSFSITPDPGVLEINLPPARSWDELREMNALVFEQARRNRLTAEKFMNDGKHVGTGGGSHIVIGGPTVAESPLLRRPDLLRSLLAFWQNHPSLSYLFSGMFIGPTSQYPRIDEARMDALYELEIAFSQLPPGECPPWLIDGLFRNLLVDMTGNTHRAEFCIDKLYPPPYLGARLGLLELRAFEMAPHLRMALAELLLIRALVSKFWREPYEGKLARWGMALHDRFLLPHFVKQDFFDVLNFLRRFGYGFEEEWYASHLEFRFPKIGSIAVQGLELELRQALEPWHVLGEEAGSGGMARSVDSSLERLQVKVLGFTAESRYAVLCNGRRLRLHSTGGSAGNLGGDFGEAVAGVRYRVLDLPSALHPTIPVQTPLVFDIVDLWNERSIGGCTYHSASPTGRDCSVRPVNASEAESRRLERFQPFGRRPGPITAPDEETNPSYPMTLDLRWPPPRQTTRPGEPGAGS